MALSKQAKTLNKNQIGDDAQLPKQTFVRSAANDAKEPIANVNPFWILAAAYAHCEMLEDTFQAWCFCSQMQTGEEDCNLFSDDSTPCTMLLEMNFGRVSRKNPYSSTQRRFRGDEPGYGTT